MIRIHHLPPSLAQAIEPLIVARIATLRDAVRSELGVMRGRGCWASPKMEPQSLVPMGALVDGGNDPARRFWAFVTEALSHANNGPLRNHRCDAWATVLPRGGRIDPHAHEQAEWSAVYYPRDGGGAIVFASGNGSESVQRFRPSAGLLLVFPGSAVHWVESSQEPGERISVAVNCYKEGGHG